MVNEVLRSGDSDGALACNSLSKLQSSFDDLFASTFNNSRQQTHLFGDAGIEERGSICVLPKQGHVPGDLGRVDQRPHVCGKSHICLLTDFETSLRTRDTIKYGP